MMHTSWQTSATKALVGVTARCGSCSRRNPCRSAAADGSQTLQYLSTGSHSTAAQVPSRAPREVPQHRSTPTLGLAASRHCSAAAARLKAQDSLQRAQHACPHLLAQPHHDLLGLRCAGSFPLKICRKPNGFPNFDHSAEPRPGASDAAAGHAETDLQSAGQRAKARAWSRPPPRGIPRPCLHLPTGLI